jgi:hypothetical protein
LKVVVASDVKAFGSNTSARSGRDVIADIIRQCKKRRRRGDRQVGWQKIPTTIAHLAPRRTLSVAIAVPKQHGENGTPFMDCAAALAFFLLQDVEELTTLSILRQ